MAKQTCCSCPGKVLIAGGYLVLEKPNVGLVVATSSRFYSLVKSTASSDTTNTVTVKSPQFLQAEWTYEVSKDGSCTQTDQAASGRNPFVEIALRAALTLAAQMGHPLEESLEIVIAGDNDFYSQDDTPNLNAAVKPFQKLNSTLKDVHKTGLGSSAAMVTSLVASVMYHLVPSPSRELIHNLAQYAHSLAQGKVGSGFDVSSAMYGSHIYTRFDPSCFGDLMDAGDETIPKTLFKTLSPETNPAWSSQRGAKCKPFTLPPYTSLLLADVNAGSNTPSMVGKVLQWRKTSPEEANALWEKIATVNDRLAKCYDALQQAYTSRKDAYIQAVEQLAKQRIHETSVDAQATQAFLRTYQTMKDFRANMSRMGQLANVPIEPEEQTRLIDACQALPGVIGGGVPGAGGYDALYILVLSPPSNPQSVQKSVQELWKGWKEMQVKPLSEAAYVHGYASNEQARVTEGLRIEQVAEVAGLAEIAS